MPIIFAEESKGLIEARKQGEGVQVLAGCQVPHAKLRRLLRVQFPEGRYESISVGVMQP
jgi:hypothetical protein